MKARCMEVHIYPEPCQPHGTVLKAFIHLLSLLLWQFQPGLSILILHLPALGPRVRQVLSPPRPSFQMLYRVWFWLFRACWIRKIPSFGKNLSLHLKADSMYREDRITHFRRRILLYFADKWVQIQNRIRSASPNIDGLYVKEGHLFSCFLNVAGLYVKKGFRFSSLS